MYFSLVHCHLSYCIDSWGWTYTTYLEPLRKLQKRSIKIITHSSHDHPSAPLFHKLQILPIDSLRQQKTAIAMNNVIRYNRPFNASILCSSSSPTRNALTYPRPITYMENDDYSSSEPKYGIICPRK